MVSIISRSSEGSSGILSLLASRALTLDLRLSDSEVISIKCTISMPSLPCSLETKTLLTVLCSAVLHVTSAPVH